MGKCIVLADRETTLGFEMEVVVAVDKKQYYDSAGRLAWSRATTVLIHVTNMKDTTSSRIRFQEALWQYSASAHGVYRECHGIGSGALPRDSDSPWGGLVTDNATHQ